MPQSVLKILSMTKPQMQLTIIILSIVFVTGGSALDIIDQKIQDLDKRQVSYEIDRAKTNEKLRSMSEKISQIHDHIVRKGLEANSANPNLNPSIRYN